MYESPDEAYIAGLIDGARMGAGQLQVGVLYYRGFKGTTSELAKHLEVPPETIVSRVSSLHEKKFIYIYDWHRAANGYQGMYAWGPNKEDVPRPPAKRELLALRALQKLEGHRCSSR